MTRAHTAWRAWTVFATAYVLVLQLLVAGFATGASAGVAPGSHGFDVICSGTSSAGAVPGEGQPTSHDGLSCCTLGCPMAGSGAVPPPGADTADILRISIRHLLLPPADAAAPPAHRVSAHSARAPPAFA